MVDLDSWQLATQLLLPALGETMLMVIGSLFFGTLIGFPLGAILSVTRRGGLAPHRAFYRVLEGIVNIGRSFPFAILMVALIPLTRCIVGTSLGTLASIVPLTVAAAPFLARLVETSLNKVDPSLIETALVMGSSTWQVLHKVMIPEALPALIEDITLAAISVVGYSAMSGLIGGGGLGQVAIQYGYHRFNTSVMILTVVLLIILVQIIQGIGHVLSKSIRRKRGFLPTPKGRSSC